MKQNTLMMAFSENWNHIRHTERERALCLEIYAAILVGSFYVLTTKAAHHLFYYVVGFLLFLTIINLLITIKIEAVINNHAQANYKIVKKLKITNYAPIRTRQTKIWDIIRVQWLFPTFYGVSFIGILVITILHPI